VREEALGEVGLTDENVGVVVLHRIDAHRSRSIRARSWRVIFDMRPSMERLLKTAGPVLGRTGVMVALSQCVGSGTMLIS